MACHMRLLILFIAALVWSSCETTPEDRYQKLATAYCECTAQLAALNRQADTAAPARLPVYFQKMQAEYDKARECAATIIAEYGHLKPAELDSLDIALSARCPALAGKRDLLQELLGE